MLVGSWWAMQTVYASRHDALLRVDVLDIGQGDAILITAPNRTRLLVDTGPNQQVLAALGAVLPSHVRVLDGILLTHPDLDHIGGTVDVFESFDVPLLLVASTSKSNDITGAIDAHGTPKEILKRGDRIMLDPVHEVYAEVLAPEAHWNSSDTNELSIVLKLVYGETCFILTGDASKNVEQAIAYAYKEELDCDVLKVGHHGSNTSTSDAFVGQVSPQDAVISLGKDNEFGHPHAEVLDTLTQFNAEIHRTDLSGTISFISDGKIVYVDKRE
jgi:competence protein ComEC